MKTEEKKSKQTLAPSSLHVLRNVIKKDRPLAERELAQDKSRSRPTCSLIVRDVFPAAKEMGWAWLFPLREGILNGVRGPRCDSCRTKPGLHIDDDGLFDVRHASACSSAAHWRNSAPFAPSHFHYAYQG